MNVPGLSNRRKTKRAASPSSAQTTTSSSEQTGSAGPTESQIVDLERRRDALKTRVAELQWDLGGLAYEMAIRERIRPDVLIKRAALLQDADSELSEIERILRLENTSTAGTCAACGAPHSTGASFCWSCGQPILQQVPSESPFA
jgi:hypothetical protein